MPGAPDHEPSQILDQPDFNIFITPARDYHRRAWDLRRRGLLAGCANLMPAVPRTARVISCLPAWFTPEIKAEFELSNALHRTDYRACLAPKRLAQREEPDILT
jgi:hypothetical protein